jgi:ribosome maturation factor RimP
MGIALDGVRRIVQEIVEGEGYELVDVELKGAGKHRVLQIFIDKENGVSHGDCQLISEQVGTVLDVEDPIPSTYTLEVSSPGLDRKLLKPSDFVRFEGHRVKVRTKRPVGERKVFEGRLAGLAGMPDLADLADLVDVQVLVETNEGTVAIELDLVQEARLAVDWKSEMTRDARSR